MMGAAAPPNLLGGLEQTAWLQQFIGAKRPKTKLK
jgi:hypothetical protein